MSLASLSIFIAYTSSSYLCLNRLWLLGVVPELFGELSLCSFEVWKPLAAGGLSLEKRYSFKSLSVLVSFSGLGLCFDIKFA